MKDINTLIPDFVEKRNVKHVICSNCGKTYDHYDLYIHGEYMHTFNDEYCFGCRRDLEDREIVNEVLKQRKLARTERAKSFSVVPVELENASFQNYQPKNSSQHEAYESSVLFANDELEQSTLFFQGDTGVGKSHLAYCVYKQFLNNGKPSIFIDLPSLLSEIRKTYNNDPFDFSSITQDQIMEAIFECELLVLDDIGAEYVKPDANGFESWVADILFQIVNARQGKKNIYTTNFTSKHLTKKYGIMSKRIISRLMNCAKIIKIQGDDHRLKGLN